MVTGKQQRADRYLDAVEREAALINSHLGTRASLHQLHLGGGTPTFLSEDQLTRLWHIVTATFDILPDAEVAVEVDPRVTTASQLTLLRGFGFTRLSMGVQDFSDDVQVEIGRVQPIEQTATLYTHARALGYRGLNFDLIYGLPRQKLEPFQHTVGQVVGMRPDRVALFSYAHVPDSRPHQKKMDETSLPSPHLKAQLFLAARRQLLDAGYLPIGFDHFAQPDDELAQAQRRGYLHRNFQGYSARPPSDTLALGITGISDAAGCYTQNVRTLAAYYRLLDQNQLPVERGYLLSTEDLMRRDVLQSMLCNFVVDLKQIATRHGCSVDVFAEEREALARAETGGLLTRKGDQIELTPLGRLLPRNVAMIFDTYLRSTSDQHVFSQTV